jgi:hypothetical protein
LSRLSTACVGGVCSAAWPSQQRRSNPARRPAVGRRISAPRRSCVSAGHQQTRQPIATWDWPDRGQKLSGRKIAKQMPPVGDLHGARRHPDECRRHKRPRGHGRRSRRLDDHATRWQRWRPHDRARDRSLRSSRGSPTPCRSDGRAVTPSRQYPELLALTLYQWEDIDARRSSASGLAGADDTAPVSRANQAAAFARMLRSRRSCSFSRRNRANSSRSEAAKPGTASSGRPSCLSVAATQAPKNCAVGSNSRAGSSSDRPARIRSAT